MNQTNINDAVRMNRVLLVGIVMLVIADWTSKFWITRQVALGESLMLIDGWLYFLHRQNTGVAFSMFADLPSAWGVPLLIGVSVIGVVLFARIIMTTGDALARAAAAVVLAGALGNLGDRLVNGHVTDFVLVPIFPFVFNVADAAITVGGIALALRLLVHGDALEPAPAEA
jgi:signal peptidase II